MSRLLTLCLLLPMAALVSCLETKSDDDDDDDDDDDSTWDSGGSDGRDDTGWNPDNDDDDDTDSDTDGGGGSGGGDGGGDGGGGGGGALEVDALYLQYEVTLRDYEMVPYRYDGTEVVGFVYFWFVDGDAWNGTDDTTNGCIVAYELSDIAGTADADLNSDAWWGWEIDTRIPTSDSDVTSLTGWSDSCDAVTNLSGHPSEVVDAHTWGIGIGPLGSDLEAALADAYGADWATYSPSAFGGYVNIDAGAAEGGLVELSYGIAFGIEDDNTLILDDDDTLSFIEVGSDGAGGTGYFRAFPAYGLDATAL